MSAKATSDLWWKNAVVYCLDVETFLDSDGDGCGDLRGLTDRIDYLAGIGVTCLWLMPFYPSSQRDDGYDITDFYGVDGRLGTPGDFVLCLGSETLVRVANAPATVAPPAASRARRSMLTPGKVGPVPAMMSSIC